MSRRTPRVTKKSVILQYLEREQPAVIGKEEAAAIRREVARALGPQARISDDYLLEVLRELGARVAPELGGFSPEIAAWLHFDSLEAAEATLRALDAHYRTGPEAAADCRRAALLVRRRAAMIARNPKVASARRAEKEEIGQWFTIWLQTPDLFFDWLEVRKKATEKSKDNTKSPTREVHQEDS